MPTVEELRISFSAKSPDQLLAILRSPANWSDEAIEAAKQCLTESDTEIPIQPIKFSVPTIPSYANLFDRCIAAMIDSFIINAPLALLAFLLFASRPDVMIPFVFLLSIPTAWIYSAFQESSTKMATIGKRTMKIHVLDLDRKRISFAKASGRHFGKYLSSFMYIGFFMAIFTKKHQALHDLISGSVLYSE